jgi:hypothetical protein
LNQRSASDAGIVDENVDPEIRLAQPRVSGCDRQFVGDVDGKQDRLGPAISNRRAGRVELGLGPRGNRNRGSGPGKRQRDGASDAAAPAGHENCRHGPVIRCSLG